MNAKTKTERLGRLISHGYFAPELPPCFVSDRFARYRKSIISAIEALPQERGKPAFHRFISEPSWFYFPRYGKDDRRHGVPNPIAHLLLSRTISDNYVDLRSIARKSGLSSSPPVFDWSGPRALIRPNIDARDDFRVDLSSRREEYVSADIRAFFHSIYTHAIPWAIYGKAWSKTHRDPYHYGNAIDLLCRNGQDGQTIGLPVGPDTSRLIAEVIVSAIDTELRTRLNIGGRDASRYIDDYTISGVNGESGEEILAALRQSAALFELELNNDKSAIYPTSHRQNTGWKQAVKAQIPPQNADGAAIQRFFYEVGQICDAHPEVNVEKYALQNARSALIRANEWKSIQSNLISAYRRNASLVSFIVEVILLRKAENNDIDLRNLKEFIEHRIPVLARSNRTGEIIWFLFMTIRLGISLSARKLSPLLSIENSMIALLVVCASSRNLVEGDLDLRTWNRALNANGLRGPMWLYAYEGVTQGFIPGATDNFIAADPYFSLLHEKRVQFLSIEQGFTSIASTLRNLRGDNDRMRRLREALADLDPEIDEFDDEDDGAGFDDDGY
uniref:Reverse transcriptase domain-containing protein n=1 Tax=Caulobacter sp. (strain K31) TaxID=366602 RepID=B0SYK9_CAUSK